MFDTLILHHGTNMQGNLFNSLEYAKNSVTEVTNQKQCSYDNPPTQVALIIQNL